MMKKHHDLVSVIVPVYNREKHLQRCFDSILAQTYDNLELICIDDGSTDSSPQICDEYGKKNSRVRVFHIKNGGVSHARNVGIEASNGKYLFFVDSDDYIEEDHIANLIPIENEDWVFCGFKILKDGECLKESRFVENKIAIDEIKALENPFTHVSFPNSMCCCCYKMSIIKEAQIKIDEKHSIAEDALFNCNYLQFCKIIKSVDKTTYCYEVGEHDSLMHHFHEDLIDVNRKIVDVKEKICEKELWALRWYAWHEVLEYYGKILCKYNEQQSKYLLKVAYRTQYFRKSIPFVRKNGSLDEKIETYFMNYYLHFLYRPLYNVVKVLSKLKNIKAHKE